MNQLKSNLQANFDTTAISTHVISFTSFDATGMNIQVSQIIVLDKEDRFMFVILPTQAPDYVFDGYVDTDKIYKDFILIAPPEVPVQ